MFRPIVNIDADEEMGETNMTYDDTAPNFADAWAIHAERDGKPWMAGWAPTEAQAQQEMASSSRATTLLKKPNTGSCK